MAGRIAQTLDQWHLRNVQVRWSKAADDLTETEPFALRTLRAEARAMRRQLDRVIHGADHRLALPGLNAGLPRMPLGTDWAWRPDGWRGTLPLPGAIADGARTGISDDLALYHDCPLAEIAIRQRRNNTEGQRAPCGLAPRRSQRAR